MGYTPPTGGYPPLTPEEFAQGCAFTYRGVAICEDEYGDAVYAYGHVNPALMVEVIHDYDSIECGVDERYESSDVRHRWAITERPADHPDGWFVRWGSDGEDFTEATPQAFRITVVTR